MSLEESKKGKPSAKKAAQFSLPSERSAKVKAQHTVKSGDTLGAIAMKYYGSAARENWMAIYEANKKTIGDDHNLIKPGMELDIPEL